MRLKACCSLLVLVLAGGATACEGKADGRAPDPRGRRQVR